MTKIYTVGESLYWSYANLGMAHAAVRKGDKAYHTGHFIIRNRLYAGFRNGTMNIGGLADDERLKLVLPQACCYCGDKNHLAVDHLIPRKRGGLDKGDNMVWSCRSCNSSKCATDVLEWLARREQFPPLLLLRRYLKLSVDFSKQNGLMVVPTKDATNLPFSLPAIPHDFPPPEKLILWVGI